MNKATLLICPVLMFVCFACTPPEEGQVVYDTAVDEESIRSMIAHYVASFVAGDLEAILTGYAVDIVQMPPDYPAIVGKPALREALQAFLDENSIMLESHVEDIRISGDLAYVRLSYEQSVTPMATGETVSEVGEWVLVIQRENGGDWKIISEIWNTDQPLDESETLSDG